jgi:TonB-linked SusC/RagA family outer membrane protein
MKHVELLKCSITRFALLLLSLMFLSAFVEAQVTISGKVTGKGNAAVSNASVVVKGTASGTSSDGDGNYSITASLKPGKYTLEFSGVGFKTKNETVTVGSGTQYTVNVALDEDALGLDEVVITGTSQGTTKKQLGSFISTVKADQLNKGVPGNVLQALQGKTPGAQIIQNSGDPGGGISVRLRGISSINSSSEPLYIVDGIIVNNATNRVTNTSSNYDGSNFVGSIGQNRMVDINPADIDRVEVLNGAAAAAIYGSRANAGVVQIFTKRGKTGVPTITFSTNVIFSSLRKKVDVNRAPTKFGASPDIFTQDILTPDSVSKTNVNRYDYQDYIFTNAVGTDNNLSIGGGTEKTKYYASVSYYKNEGIIRNTDFSRLSIRTNIDQTINSKLSFNVGFNYVLSSANEKPDGNSFFSPMNSVTILGNFHDLFTRDVFGNIKKVGERGRTNPVSVIEDIKQRQETNRLLSNLGIKFKPAKNLTFDYTLGFDTYSQTGTTFIPPYAYNVNPAFWGGGDPALASNTSFSLLNGYASAATNNFFQINHELNATYTAKINADITSTTQAGYSLQYEKSNYVLLQGRGLAPFIRTANSAATPLPGVDDRSELSISGGYVQQNFKFKSQAFITVAARMDGSSVFGEDQRNQLYLKASGSYLISETDFWVNSSVSSWWDLFKVRMAYGQSGNLTGIGAYSRFNVYTPFPINSRIAFNSANRLSNEQIAPERQNELEIGADLSFLKNRINLQFNYYNKRVNDLIIDRFVAPTTGYASFLNNIGSLENKGIEILLSGSPVRKKDLSWTITAIYSRNRNKALNIGQSLLLLNTNGGAPIAIAAGQPVGVFYGTFFAKDNNGNQIKNTAGFPQIERGVQNGPLAFTPSRDPGTGLPTGTTLRKVIGDPNPDYTATIVNEVSYKRFSFRFQLDAVQGVDVFNADWRTRQGVGNGKVAEQEHLGQLPRGYINSIYAIEEWRIDDGSFVKLRELSLSYSTGRIGKVLNDVTFSFSGRNLISWDNYKGYDPEVNAGGQSTLLRGVDFGAVPIPRTFSFGVTAKF